MIHKVHMMGIMDIICQSKATQIILLSVRKKLSSRPNQDWLQKVHCQGYVTGIHLTTWANYPQGWIKGKALLA